MDDFIDGVSLLLFGLLLAYLGIWQFEEATTARGWLGRLFLTLWGGVLIGSALIDALAWLSTVSVCIRCG